MVYIRVRRFMTHSLLCDEFQNSVWCSKLYIEYSENILSENKIVSEGVLCRATC